MCNFGSYILTFIKAKFACFIDNETRRPVSVACTAMGKKINNVLFLFLLHRAVMEWTKQHDRALLDEITVSDLFQFKKGTPERGQVWDSIADNLNALDYPKFKVAKRSCRDRWTLLRTKYKRRMSEELQASGIDAEVSESDTIIEDLIGKEDTAVDSGKDGKKKAEADKKAAKEVRTKAMERLGQSSKRNGDEGEGVKKKKRKSASDAVEFLREKAKLDHALKEEELQLRKDQQSQTMLLLQQQQQMNQAFLSLVNKMLSKEKN